MSTSSIARQNRRLRQKRLAQLSAGLLDPIALSSSSISSILNPAFRDPSVDEASGSNQASRPESAICSTPGSKCGVSSIPLGKIFIEDERGFRAIDINELQAALNATAKVQNTGLAIELAYRASKHFHRWSIFCHGVLGGMSLVHLLLLLHFVALSDDKDMLEHFGFLSQPINNIFNFFCIVCCVSAFDRYDIGNPKQLFAQMKKCDIKMFVIVLYPLCLLLSISTTNVDEKLCLPTHNMSIAETFDNEEGENELFYWRTLSISKCAVSMVSWLLITLAPNKNLFLKKLEDIIKKNATAFQCTT